MVPGSLDDPDTAVHFGYVPWFHINNFLGKKLCMFRLYYYANLLEAVSRHNGS